ncbi:MAG: superoxide dismutase [Deltaproteobacteria bacterium]|nr:superoxide dismutase [Deltaproteobacteria bacterium]
MSEKASRAGLTRREFVTAAAVAAGAAALSLAGAPAQAAPAMSEEVVLPPLPWKENALEPIISARTISFHYGKHHAGYVKNTNKLLASSPLKGLPLPEIIAKTYDKQDQVDLFNNAAQVWNHTFYWNSLSPVPGEPNADFMAKVKESFGSLPVLKATIQQAAARRFGSGWAWVVLVDGKLKVWNTANADTPLAHGAKPLLTVDVWEHAYYLDYQNRRGDYVKGVLDHLANWGFASQNLTS